MRVNVVASEHLVSDSCFRRIASLPDDMASEEQAISTDSVVLKNLRRERGQLKATLTRYETFLDSSPEQEAITLKWQQIEPLLSRFETVQRKFAAFENPASDDDPILEEFASKFDDLLVRTSRMRRPVSPTSGLSTVAVASDKETCATAEVQCAPKAHPNRLPAIALPTFAGDPLMWEAYRDLFISLVHEDQGLTNVQRFHYLKSTLSGEALEPLDHYAITDANYTQAWTELRLLYDNERILLSNHWAAFAGLAPVQRECPTALRTLFSGVERMRHALRSLGREASAWDDFLVFFIVERLDATTRREWEHSQGKSTAPPSFKTLTTFAEGRIQALKSMPTVRHKPPSTSRTTLPTLPTASRTPTPLRTGKVHHASTTTTSTGCAQCRGPHAFMYCPEVTALTPGQRRNLAGKLRLCYNCLRRGHQQGTCPSSRCCTRCQQRHHTILHEASSQTTLPNARLPSPPRGEPARVPASTEEVARVHLAVPPPSSPVALATAYVQIRSPSGQTMEVRALLDQGSDWSFLSEAVAQTLQLAREQADVALFGLGDVFLGTGTQVVLLEILAPQDPAFSVPVLACVKTRLTRIPPTSKGHRDWPHLRDLSPLADDGRSRSSKIDLVLGSDVYGALLSPGLRQGPLGSPTAQMTKFGWIISGPTSQRDVAAYRHRAVVARACHATSLPDVSDLLRRFWEIEEVPVSLPLSPDDEQCEQHFQATHRRTSAGRYVVRLPFGSTPLPAATNSLPIALNCLRRLERRQVSDALIRDKYVRFMREYETLGHMHEVADRPRSSTTAPFYLPHHGVLRGDGVHGKLRVVFNASQKTSLGASLNDYLLTGPVLQSALIDVILKWRKFAIVMAADIEKMYRQIEVHDDDAELQRIVWREDPSKPVRHFRLNTVTYGTSCAPYLAIRTLRQLATDEEHRFPQAAAVVRQQTYVDDIFAGADDVESAHRLRDELQALLRAGGFELRKWSSNRPELLAEFPPEWLQVGPRHAFDDDRIRALGLEWSPQLDAFSFQVAVKSAELTPPTKRSLLSTIARIFDPAGWLAPVVIVGKILLQDLWMAGLDWDAPLPGPLASSWREFCQGLSAVSDISIPRWIGVQSAAGALQLHGFADASSRAYAAAVYLRVEQPSGVSAVLIAARTKVAPVKQLSIPKLELCGAALLSCLMTHIRSALNLSDVPIYMWSDSMVALSWLRAHPSRWSTFVANRVSTIQSALPGAHWRHVPSADNPADVASRGIAAAALRSHHLWWTGPTWLPQDATCWPTPAEPPPTNLEVRSIAKACAIVARPVWDLCSRFSSVTRLWRVTAWCRRFLNNLKRSNPRLQGPLTADEIRAARIACVTIVQTAAFADDIANLTADRGVSSSSPLRTLRPFVDTDGLLRVGGRLQGAAIPYEQRHPAILPAKSPLAALVVEDAHRRVLHGGPQLTLSHVMTRYWVLGARNLTRAIVHRCVRCSRFRAANINPIMGNLPAARVTPARPFQRTGLDYAGPVHLRASSGRGRKVTKGYIALFVCLWSKAVHLEVVSDCSTAAFLAAYKRFTSRRGLCAELLSDNATTFHGANAELQRMLHDASATHRDVAAIIANDGTRWTFIPPSAPHFGGLWEAGVRSTKHHLRRVIGDHILTFEELTTVLTQIEACLNSRPLTPLSPDSQDLAVLTPGHFLVGGPLLAVPEPTTLDVQLNRLSRWQTVTNIRDHFWRRWSAEYLHQLQQRTKWSRNSESLQIGRLVLLKDDRMPPTKWSMGRITAIHPGLDGVVRVVTVTTATSTLTRPVAKLCPLPICEQAP